MVTQLSLTYSKANISRDILTNFLIENEAALSFLPIEKILPSQPLLSIIQTPSSCKLGTLHWGHPTTYETGTILFEKLKKNTVLKKHLHLHRCLILADKFTVKENYTSRQFLPANHEPNNLMYFAGLYLKQIIHHKTHYFALLITQIYQGQELPVLLNHDQLKFYLNPTTIVDELTFLFYQHQSQQLFRNAKKEG
jgi:putative SOS response-associated peptidase YedK